MFDPKKARLELGLSQSQMAKLCNTNVGTIRKWEQRDCDGRPYRIPRGQAVRLIEVMLLWKQGKLNAYFEQFIKRR